MVRGGGLRIGALRGRAIKDLDRLGYFGISVFADDQASVQDLVEAGPVPHARLQRSTAGRIRAAGFDIEPTFDWPHCTVKLGDRLTDDVLRQLIVTFDPPEDSP